MGTSFFHIACRAALLCAVLTACGEDGGRDGAQVGALSGSIVIDGSSTVFPIAEAVAEEFQLRFPSVRVSVGFSGSGGGFERFCNEEIDLTNASRPMRAPERAVCAEAGIEFTELPIAKDGIAVVAHPDNDFATCLTLDELRRVWSPDGGVARWSDLRSGWPDEPIQLYGPGPDSGTFDFFTETVNGEWGRSRRDFQASEDDNILVQGVGGDTHSLGYFGFAYYGSNADRLALIAVDVGTGCVRPSGETIADGSYAPLIRPLYVYVRNDALDRPEVREYLDFLVRNAEALVSQSGYQALPSSWYADDLALLAQVNGGAD